VGAGLVRKERVSASYYQMSRGGYFFFPAFFALFFGLALVFLPVLQPAGLKNSD
jgi:hypothetical protein